MAVIVDDDFRTIFPLEKSSAVLTSARLVAQLTTIERDEDKATHEPPPIELMLVPMANVGIVPVAS